MSASLFLALLAPALLPPSASSFESGSASFSNKRSSLNQGGKRQSSSGSTYSNVFSAGEVSLTTHTSTTYATRSGFETVAFYPGRVTGLYSSSGTAEGTIYLQWTAPGNDGYAPGTSAGRYDIRLSSIASLSPAISDSIFNAAAAITPAPPTPASQGATQPTTASGLLEGVTYYFAMKARERDGIPGVLSAGTTAQSAGPFGCRIVKNVCKSGNCGFTTIQGAVNALPNPLLGHSCVIVRDSELYSEQVTVEGFVNNGSSITIARGPEVLGRPSVAPPAASTAAFRVVNSSVNIFNIDAKPAVSVAYAIFASSAFVKISSVNVDAGASVWSAGLRLADWGTVSASSVSVANAGALALHLSGASSATVTGSFFSNAAGRAARLDAGAFGNLLALSTFTAASASTEGAVELVGASSNTLTRVYSLNASGRALFLSNAHLNTVRLSTITAQSVSEVGLLLNANSSSNTFTGLSIRTQGYGVRLLNGSNNNSIALSTVTGHGVNYAGLSLLSVAANSVSGSYIQGSTAVWVDGSTGTVLNGNRIVATNAAKSGVWLTGGSVGLSASSNTISGGAQRAGVYLDLDNSGAIILSTNTIAAGAQIGLYAANQRPGTALWITSNTVVASVSSAQDTYGIYLAGLTSGATLYNNSVVYRTPGSMGVNTAYALFVQSGAALKIDNNRFSNPGMITAGSFGGVYFSGTQGASFKFNDLHSAGPALSNAFLLQLAAGTTIQARNNIFLSSMTVSGSSATLSLSADSGIDSDYNNFFSSTTPSYFVWGSTSGRGLAAWQALSGKDLYASTYHPLWFNAAAGVEDFHPLSQGTGAGTGRCSNPPYCTTFVNDPVSSLTIDSADPAEPFANEQAPNGNVANQGSFGNTHEASMSPPILSVVLSTGLYDFGSVNMNVYGSTISVSSVVATNNGSVTETFQLSAAVVTPGGSVWQLGQQPAIETVKLQALFNSTQPSDSAFSVVASTVTAAPQPSGDATNNGNNYAGDQSGFQVPAQGKRGMWFKLTPPTSTVNNGVPQTIRVTVTAIP